MANYLIKVTEEIRVPNVEAAEKLHEEIKADSINQGYNLNSFSYVHKDIKSKGEIIESYELCKLTKIFNNVKEPEMALNTITYSQF